MSDFAHEYTDELLAALEKSIAEIYAVASKELNEKVIAYFAKFVKRDEEMRKKVEEGEVTDNDYKQWRLAQMGRGERFQKMRDNYAKRVNEANRAAAAYINDSTPGIYTLNRNFTAYTIEQVCGDVGFDLYDEQTVRRLIADQPELLPAPRVDIPADLKWNRQKMTAELTSGILQGESIGKLADRFQKVTDMNRTSAVRNARTAVTGAQNAGRQASYDRAKEMNLPLRKCWIATKDGRTRHNHRRADKQTVALDEPFTVGSDKLMYPGVTNGSPKNIYNCRCTMRTVEKEGIEAEPRMMRVRNPVTGKNELVSDMSYQEWYEWKRNQDPKAFDIAEKKIKNESSDKAQFERYKEVLGKNAPKTFADFQDLKYNSGDWSAYKDYVKSIRTGELTALSDFSLYKKTSNEIDRVLVGTVTLDGIEITGKSKHYIARAIGSVEDRRNGVSVESTFKALTEPTRIINNRESKKYILDGVCAVSVNPGTGKLIQVNPLHHKE